MSPNNLACLSDRRRIKSARRFSNRQAIVDIAAPFGPPVHDHIIVGKNGHASLKGLRLI